MLLIKLQKKGMKPSIYIEAEEYGSIVSNFLNAFVITLS